MASRSDRMERRAYAVAATLAAALVVGAVAVALTRAPALLLELATGVGALLCL